MSVLDKIREAKRIERMRLGQNAPNIVSLVSAPEVRLAMVPLNEGDFQAALAEAAAVDLHGGSPYGIELADRTLQVHTLLHALRDPDSLSKKAFPSAEEMVSEDALDAVDVNKLMEEYEIMMADVSPDLSLMSDEQMDAAKKALGGLDWSVLSGKQQWHLLQVFSTLTVDQLQARSPSPSSTQSLTSRSEEVESTHTA